MNNFLAYLKSHTRIIVVTAVALFSMAVPYWVFLQIRDTNHEAARLIQEIKDAADQQAKLEATKKLFEETEKSRDVVEGAFVEKDGVVDLANTLERFGRLSGATSTIVSLTQADKKVETASGLVGQVVVNLRVSGSWDEVVNYLARVESLPLAFNFDQVALKAQVGELGKTKTAKDWELLMALRFYQYQK